MKRLVTLLCLPLLAAFVGSAAAFADSTDAHCQVIKHGETKSDRSGHCTFSQRQGYIDLDLRNGETYSLSPGSKPNHFHDQKGNKVIRTSAGGDTQRFQWEGGKTVIVTFRGASPSSASSAGDRVAVADMPRYCAGEAAAKFRQSPRDITTNAAQKDHGMHSVWGQYPAQPSPQVFICTFDGEGRFVGVDLNRP